MSRYPGVWYGQGPAKAWDKAIEIGLIEESDVITAQGRAWAIGHYL